MEVQTVDGKDYSVALLFELPVEAAYEHATRIEAAVPCPDCFYENQWILRETPEWANYLHHLFRAFQF